MLVKLQTIAKQLQDEISQIQFHDETERVTNKLLHSVHIFFKHSYRNGY